MSRSGKIRAWREILLLTVLVLGAGAVAERASAAIECPSIDLAELQSRRDYRSALVGLDRSATSDWQRLKTVELNHLNENVRTLTKGQSVAHPGGDLMFILGIFPNHTPALELLVRLAVREDTVKPKGVGTPVPCTLQRAVAFRPDDAQARMIYGIYLARIGENEDAIKQLETAEKAASTDANILYNLGLLYFEKKNYDKALAYAQRAYERGFPLPGLKNKLSSVGKWREAD